jgi:hypothetical protein
MIKKLASFLLIGAITVTSVFSCFATTDTSGVQNDPYFGVPVVPYVLGEFDTNGFLYSKSPLKDMHASDIGLIPSPVASTYKSPSTWAKDEVIEASKLGLNNMDIITGYQGDITRVEFARLIVQAYFKYSWQFNGTLNVNIPADWEDLKDVFTDIKDADKDNITIAYCLGITNGVSTDKFNPNAKISRQEIATMLYRYIYIFDSSISSLTVKKNYDDDAKIATWAKLAVRAMSNREVIKGFPGNLFKPLDSTTREQALLLDLRANKEFIDQQVTNDLSTPSGLAINGNKLVWGAVNNSQNYNIYQVKKLSNTNFEYTYYNRSDTTNFDLSSLNTHAGTYYFSIQAFNEFHQSAQSQPITVIVPDPVKDTSITYTDAGNTLKWDKVDNATKYVVSVTNATGNPTTYSSVQDVAQSATPSVVLAGLPAGSFNVQITAYTNDFYAATTSKTISNTP